MHGDKDSSWGYTKKEEFGIEEGSTSSGERERDLEANKRASHPPGPVAPWLKTDTMEHGVPRTVDGMGGEEEWRDHKRGQIVKTVHINQHAGDP